MQKLRSLKFYASVFAMLLALPVFAHAEEVKDTANKVDVLIGFYSLNIENAKTGQKTSLSALGAYQVRYRRDFDNRFDFGAAYSLYQSKIVGGDSYYGLDLFAEYFPLTSSHPQVAKGEGVSFTMVEKLRPYVGVSFHQRSFQGIQTGYTGFAGSLGTEYSLSANTSLLVNLRFMKLKASSDLTGSETALQAGLSFGF